MVPRGGGENQPDDTRSALIADYLHGLGPSGSILIVFINSRLGARSSRWNFD
jgi:hypothetical protein